MHDLVSTAWLADQLGADDLAILDASLHLPAAKRDAARDFAEAHIPGARFLDLAGLADKTSSVPSAVPSGAQLADRLAALGIRATDRVVIYDDSAVESSARAWFILRLYGWQQVAVLDGGFGKWRAERRPMEAGIPDTAAAEKFTPAPGSSEARTKDDLLANLRSHDEQVLDARSASRFSGEETEAAPGLAGGHIPGSRNLPYNAVLHEDGTFKEPGDLRRAFIDAGVDLDQPIVTTCGSGVTAAVLLFAARLAGKRDVSLYDGSWSEWGADLTTPKATGAAD